MSDLDALLKAILANPEEDTPRLVYADALQERGEPGDEERAEFIRVQVAISRTAPDELCPRCIVDPNGHQKTNGPCRCTKPLWALRRRSRELLAFDWCPVAIPRTTPRIRTAPVDIELLDGNGLRAAFRSRRGFVARCWLPAADWLAHSDAILAAHPVTAVALTTIPELKFVFAGGGQPRAAHLPGRRQHRSDYGSWAVDRGIAIGLLRANWPGVTFTLPG